MAPSALTHPRPSYGAVACGHPATAQAAAEVLRDGGNAFDAALAAMCAATVAEPVLCSLAGGGFLLAKPADEMPVVYDFFVDTPRHRRPLEELDFFPIDANFGTTSQEFHIGLGAMATPGMVKGLFEISQSLGRMPMQRIVAPAVRMAREGVPLRPIEQYICEVVGPILTAYAEARESFTVREPGSGQHRLPHSGEKLPQPALADSLEALAKEGEQLFYQGEMGKLIVRICAEAGGQITQEDLTSYRVERRQPLTVNFRNARIATNPPPSSGGILIAFALTLLEDAVAADLGPGALAVLARAMSQTNKARLEADLNGGQTGNARPELLFDSALVARYRAAVAGRPYCPRGTTHISVADAAGNLAAVTLSNGEGCGIMLPGMGIMLNNMLGEEDLNPGGFHCWQAGQRMTSMMAPTILTEEDGTETAVGSGGSNRIRSAILQVLLNLIDRRLSLADAVAAPRLHVERGVAHFEAGHPDDALEALAAEVDQLRPWPQTNLYFGGVHGVRRHADGSFEAVGDSRRGGTASIESDN